MLPVSPNSFRVELFQDRPFNQGKAQTNANFLNFLRVHFVDQDKNHHISTPLFSVPHGADKATFFTLINDIKGGFLSCSESKQS